MSQHHWDDVQESWRTDMRRVLKPTGRIRTYDARFALRRADQAARKVFPAAVVRRVPVRTGHGFLRLFARLSIETTLRWPTAPK
jgi:hypothetical protein